MSIIDRYLMQVIVSSALLTLLIFVGLIGFINFAMQIDDIGTGQYELPNAITYVLLLSPKHAFELMPISTLIGTLMGLGTLAAHSELVVMRVSGISRIRFAGSVVLSGVVLVFVAIVLGEFIGPPAEQLARTNRTLQKYDQINLTSGLYAWVRDGNTFVNFRPLDSQGGLGGIYLFRFNDDRELESVGQARSGGFDEQQNWELDDYRETTLTDKGAQTRFVRRIKQESGLSRDILGLSIVDPDRLGSVGLFNYVRYLKNNAMDSQRYEVAFWARIANTVSILAMTLLALPFAFGTLRSSGAGARLLTGILIGTAFFFASRTLTNSGQVFGLNPLLIAWLPTFFVTLVAAAGISRIR